MPPIEMRPVRAVAGYESHRRPAELRTEAAAPTANTPSVSAAGKALDPGSAPVDVQRVSEIRKAIENGTYPVIPARIADAMIAAGFLLQASK